MENNGFLLLEASSETLPHLIEALCPNILKLVGDPNLSAWVFQKVIQKPPYGLAEQYEQAILNKAPLENILVLLDEYEQFDPSSPFPFYARQKLLNEYHMPSLAKQDWQRYVDRLSAPSSQMFAILSTILGGDYQEGFRKREMILGDQHLRRTPTPPDESLYSKRWKGESLSGKAIVVWTEFGLGDEIMFAQLAHYLKRQGASQVIWIAQMPIVALLKTHPDIDQVIEAKRIREQLGEFDYWVYPHEILVYVNTPFDYLPKRQPYLSAEPSKSAAMAAYFTETGNLKVGIVWRGDPTHENDRYRSIHCLDYIETLFNTAGIDWYCLQKACNEEELALLAQYRIPHLAKTFQDFTETVAALTHLDYVVSVDTSVVHLAGAMGIPTLIMLPYIVDWRWGIEGKSNKWYPSIEAFRNERASENWENVITAIQQALTLRMTWKTT